MKKSLLIALFSLAFLSAFATIWHVNNNAGVTSNFNSLDAAFSSSQVVNGDTLYVYGSGMSYGSPAALTKRLTLIGPGYFLNQNGGLQYNQMIAAIDYLSFQAGSEGSLASGLVISSASVSAANVVLQRNNLSVVTLSANNCMVLQNFFNNVPYYNYPLYVYSPSTVVVANNFIPYGIGNNWAYYMEDGCSSTFYNNTVRGGCRFVNTEVYNCVIGWHSYPWEFPFAVSGSTSIHHTVLGDFGFDWSSYTNDPTNLYNVADQIFMQTGSTDGYYQLCDGSPAIGAGVGGADCGMFGGATPYKLSGIPAIPTIYNFVAPATGFTIPIQIGARSNN